MGSVLSLPRILGNPQAPGVRASAPSPVRSSSISHPFTPTESQVPSESFKYQQNSGDLRQSYNWAAFKSSYKGLVQHRVSPPPYKTTESESLRRGTQKPVMLARVSAFQTSVCVWITWKSHWDADSDSGGLGWGQRGCISNSPQGRLMFPWTKALRSRALNDSGWGPLT